MSKPRLIAYLLFCGCVPVLWKRLANGEWPAYSALHWAVWLGGLVVLIVVSVALDSRATVRRRAREGQVEHPPGAGAHEPS
ncbi:hypothetical protein ABLE68_08805 [Nocardioides sp. CN2-186]|uniref:hypothetical protein n=1 Tax=Nocardioides tweenelious TaxID=3156607 RepID=UPI0032B51156